MDDNNHVAEKSGKHKNCVCDVCRVLGTSIDPQDQLTLHLAKLSASDIYRRHLHNLIAFQFSKTLLWPIYKCSRDTPEFGDIMFLFNIFREAQVCKPKQDIIVDR